MSQVWNSRGYKDNFSKVSLHIISFRSFINNFINYVKLEIKLFFYFLNLKKKDYNVIKGLKNKKNLF